MGKTLIIGGGVSGLSAGIYALLGGEDAIICERGARAGGNLTGWDRGGCHVDNCIHWLTGTNTASPTYKIWEELGALGGEVGVVRPPSLYTCRRGGDELTLWRDVGRLQDDMIRRAPREEKRIRAFISDVRQLQRIFGIGGENHDEAAGQLEKALAIPRFYKYYRMTAGELAHQFDDPLIREFLSCLLTEDFGSLALLCVFAHFCGGNADLPEGGSAAMAKRMADRFRSLGGTLLTNAEIRRVVANGRQAFCAVLTDGREVFFDDLVAACDPALFFGGILNAKMPRRLAQKYTDHRLFRFSSWHAAFLCDLERPPFSGNVVVRVPGDMRRRIDAGRVNIREFSHEPGFAPAGKTVLQTLAFCDEFASLDFIDLARDREKYSREKERLGAAAQALIEREFPETAGRLTLLDVWTPATYRDYFGSETGSYMSFAFSSGVLPSRIPSKVDGFDNVYLATQWQEAPGGLPIAAACGRAAAREICRAHGSVRAEEGGRAAPSAVPLAAE